MAALWAQGHESCAGNQKSEMSVRRRHDLEAAVQLHGVGGGVHRRAAFTRHLWSGGRTLSGRRLSQTQGGAARRVRREEVHSVDLGQAGRQVAEEASPHLCVHPFTRGQEAGHLSHTLTVAGSVFTQHGGVCVHSSCGEKKTQIYE